MKQLKLPSSSTQPAQKRQKQMTNGPQNAVNNPTTQQPTIKLLPISELPPKFRPIFPYVTFNHVQSLVYDAVMTSNKPIVVSAPTGSGKTGVFELAIVKVLIDAESRPIDFGGAKIIYLAPTKALCAERKLDWGEKFKYFNIQCQELTSDVTSPVDFKSIKKTSILLATPEKWDSITRSWVGNRAFIQSVRLLLIDEVHLVNDGSRGATLEAVISRMKIIRSQIWPSEQDNLRFVAVSATVSNVYDIADWFSTPTSNAEVYQVNPEQRPVKLRAVVLGYSFVNNNYYRFDQQLNKNLINVIEEYSNKKPTLIFCATRKFAEYAATTLTKESRFEYSFSAEKRKLYEQMSMMFTDKQLKQTSRFGVAFHHAGLTADDRRLIASGFLDGRIMVLCCTSTLAMGVNLPAHLVIIKGTCFFDDGQFKPYTESSLVQMMGRAGRPQFDTEATAVIMTTTNCRDTIQKMLSGQLVVDSQLHKFLTEHLNSEVVLGTINNDAIARKWIESTFLRVRLMKNPENYGLKAASSATVKEKTLMAWCLTGLEKLLTHRMIRKTTGGQLESTEPGKAMAKHYICLDTMIKLTQLTGSETIFKLLMIICSSNEVVSDVTIRNEDKAGLLALASASEEHMKLKFPIENPLQSREKKICTLIQGIFGNMVTQDKSIHLESGRILRNATRVMNCLKDISLTAKTIYYGLLKNVLILAQCFAARLWFDSIFVSKQLEKIGATYSQSLANNGLTTFESLRKANPHNIEVFCHKLPPFGVSIQKVCFGLPIYDLKVQFRRLPHEKEKIQLMVEVILVNGLDMRSMQSLPKCHESTLIIGNLKDNKVLLKQQVTDVVLLSRPDLTWCFGTDLDRVNLPGHLDDIEVMIISEMFVGLNICKIVKYRDPEE